MIGYGALFDYQLSATVFEALTLCFVAAYGLVVVVVTARP